jgi:hypothetical protein
MDCLRTSSLSGAAMYWKRRVQGWKRPPIMCLAVSERISETIMKCNNNETKM